MAKYLLCLVGASYYLDMMPDKSKTMLNGLSVVMRSGVRYHGLRHETRARCLVTSVPHVTMVGCCHGVTLTSLAGEGSPHIDMITQPCSDTICCITETEIGYILMFVLL